MSKRLRKEDYDILRERRAKPLEAIEDRDLIPSPSSDSSYPYPGTSFRAMLVTPDIRRYIWVTAILTNTRGYIACAFNRTGELCLVGYDHREYGFVIFAK